MCLLSACIALCGLPQYTAQPLLDWADYRLLLYHPLVSGEPIPVWWLEAVCRSGSTSRRWEETVIPGTTVRLNGSGKAERVTLRTSLTNGVEIEHDLRAVREGLVARITIRNTTDRPVDAAWAQPCIQVAGFTGRSQETYLDRCFLFTQDGPRFLHELPRASEALYQGGQVYVPAPVPRDDVNPRPISEVQPARGLIGCVSADGRFVLATAWSSTQELFQGVITCIHSDLRIGGLRPRETKRLTGRIYLLPNDLPALLRRYEKDFPDWRRDMGVDR